MHRFQISVFGAIAVVFSVIGVNQSIFSNLAALDAMAAGWLILSVVNILWTLYFTSEEDSLMLHIFNSMGTGGLTPPGRRRRRTQSMHNMGGNGYTAGYAAPGALGPTGYDAKPASFAGGPMNSGASFKANSVDARSLTGQSVNQNAGSMRGPGSYVGADPAVGLASPAMSSGAAGVGAGGGQGPIQNVPSGGSGAASPVDQGAVIGPGELVVRAKAMYPCKSSVRQFRPFRYLTAYQTKQILKIQTKFHSRRTRLWRSWTSRVNGGRRKKRMAQ